MAAKDLLQTWLKRFVLFLTAVLLCCLIFFVWRLSMLVQRLDGSVAALSSDVGKVTRSVSDIAGDLLDPKQLVDELSGGADSPVDPATAKEVRYLMDCIGQPDLRYEYGEDKRGAAWVQAKFWMKYRAFSSDIGSGEDFIGKVASKTHENETYYVVEKNGNKIELSVFLTEALRKYRLQEAGQGSRGPGTPSGGPKPQPKI